MFSVNLRYRSRSGDQILSHDSSFLCLQHLNIRWQSVWDWYEIHIHYYVKFWLGTRRVIYNISWTCKTGHIYISKNKDQSLLSCSVLPEISLSDLFFLLKVGDKMFGDCKSQRFMTGEMLANFSKLIICQTLTSWSWTICRVFSIGFLQDSWIIK